MELDLTKPRRFRIRRVKYIFSICGLHQKQIDTCVFKSITNGTSIKQIKPLGTSVKIMLGFFNEVPCHPYTWRGTYGFKALRDIVPKFRVSRDTHVIYIF